ncbi:PIF1 helicase, partial [Amia calva]|nr:PIF1 helicase [Amia calva]
FMTEFSNLLSDLAIHYDKLINLGDFNIHIHIKDDPLTVSFFSLLESVGFTQHVSGPTHRHNHTLDLDITRGVQIHNLIISPQNQTISDHCLITFELPGVELDTQERNIETRCLNPTAIHKFTTLLPNASFIKTGSADELLNNFNNTLSTALDTVAPLRTRQIKPTKHSPCFDEHTHSLKTECRKCERKWRETKLEVFHMAWNESIIRYKQALSSARSAYYSNLIDTHKNNPRFLFNTIATLTNQQVKPSEVIPPNFTCSDFMDHFNSKVNGIRKQIEQDTFTDNIADTCSPSQPRPTVDSFNIVNHQELVSLITKMKTITCALDPIPTKLLKQSLPLIIHRIHNIINVSLSSGSVPESFKIAVIKPLLKKSSANPNQLKHYRPISNLPFLSKVLEKVVANQLQAFLVMITLISPLSRWYTHLYQCRLDYCNAILSGSTNRAISALSLDASDTDENIPDLLLKDKNVVSLVENCQCTISKEDAEYLLRSLNDKQCEIFYKIRQWCLTKSLGDNPEPLRVFVTGGAGTGKSHLIKALYYESSRILARTAPNPDDICVLLTASTGVAAYNIGAATIHSTFAIGIDAKLPYQPLGEEKINTLWSKFGNLQVLIIDEISMVDHNLVAYIHGRLRQIKQTGDHSLFGKVSIIAVGDFYQLSPMKGTALYNDTRAVNLWNDEFCVAELTEIVRQTDPEFAQMLNRLRTRKKCDQLNENDATILKSCETGEESQEIHIFATNEEVDRHNLTMLHSICPEPIYIKAEDFSRNPKSGKLEKKDGHHYKVLNTCLAKTVSLAAGARVMLLKNIDVEDGLVNGVFGTVSDICLRPGECFPFVIYVLFDNPKVGQKLRGKKNNVPGIPDSSTPIEPQEDQVTNSGGVRRQFPLKLAWACTVHKVQGLTVEKEKAVVSLGRIFAPGQAYVALSRVTALNGLTIQDFKDSAIYCNGKVETALTMMPKFNTPVEGGIDSDVSCTIIMLNIQGLQAHVLDLESHKRIMNADFICLTETWLTAEWPQEEPKLNGFTFHHKPRLHCYDTSVKLFAELKQQCHGGVGMYCRNYAAIQYFKSYLYLHLFKKFKQYVKGTTTERGTLIDHVYVKDIDNVAVQVLPTYFSFHEAISVTST